VGFGFVTAAVGLVSITAARLTALPVLVILKAVEILCNVLTALPYAYITTGQPDIYLLFLYGAVLVTAYILLCDCFGGRKNERN
jgi:hypothetical protein